MSTRTARLLIATAIAFAGWSFGRAQTTVADFEIEIDAPGPGQVNLTCVRGCNWLNGRNTSYFSCAGNATRCGGVVDGRGVFLRHRDGTTNKSTPAAAPK
jgi:hypothetical protein